MLECEERKNGGIWKCVSGSSDTKRRVELLKWSFEDDKREL
jgi:hypothetical protein